MNIILKTIPTLHPLPYGLLIQDVFCKFDETLFLQYYVPIFKPRKICHNLYDVKNVFFNSIIKNNRINFTHQSI